MNENVRKIIKDNKIRLTKSLGQNFLINTDIINKIVDSADVNKSDVVIEIGPGIGNMTSELAKRAGEVIAIEIDKHLIDTLKKNLDKFSNVKIINEDILKVNVREIIEGYNTNSIKVVANLPYYITTPIIMKFLEEELPIDTLVFMIQKEVASRMVAKPSSKDYGVLSLAVQYYSVAEKVFDVSPHNFIPQPEVDSTVIRLTVRNAPPVNLCNKDLFFKVIKSSFMQRRKTILNALHNAGCFNVTKEQLKNVLLKLNINENRRGETLSMQEFADLSNTLHDINMMLF